MVLLWSGSGNSGYGQRTIGRVDTNYRNNYHIQTRLGDRYSYLLDRLAADLLIYNHPH